MKKIFYVAICIMACLVSCEEKELVSPKNPTTDNPRTDNPTTDNPTIEEPVTEENGHAYVDLGLSVKWATCNVGASKPEEYGDYFTWGETKPKSTYSYNTNKWNKGGNGYTKYCFDYRSGYNGFVDNKRTLDLSDDAARANWGGSWRMPTMEEQCYLFLCCSWEWTTQNGVKGYKVTSRNNGNSIFLPAAGYRYDSSLKEAGSLGYYWSNGLIRRFSSRAYCMCFYSSNVESGDELRFFGLTVRPVCP